MLLEYLVICRRHQATRLVWTDLAFKKLILLFSNVGLMRSKWTFYKYNILMISEKKIPTKKSFEKHKFLKGILHLVNFCAKLTSRSIFKLW